MATHAAVTVNRPREEVERLWHQLSDSLTHVAEESVRFADAPGDRGTEIHAEPGGSGTGALTKLRRAVPLAKAKDDLRRFKQIVETGEVTRSEGSPEGELAERKLKQRPAQPLKESELEKAGA
jgi:uncharacterized membrane protein